MAAAVHEKGGYACKTDFPDSTSTQDAGIASMSAVLALLLTCNLHFAGCSASSSDIPPDPLKPLTTTGKIKFWNGKGLCSCNCG